MASIFNAAWGLADTLKLENEKPLGLSLKGSQALTVIVTDDYLQSVFFVGSRNTVRWTVTISSDVREEDGGAFDRPTRVEERVMLKHRPCPEMHGRVPIEGSVLQLTVLGLRAEGNAVSPSMIANGIGRALKEMLEFHGDTPYGVSQFLLSMGAVDVSFPGWDWGWTFIEQDRKALAVGTGIATILVEVSRHLMCPPSAYIGASVLAGCPGAVPGTELLHEQGEYLKGLPLQVFRYLRKNHPGNPWGVLESEEHEAFQVYDLFGSSAWLYAKPFDNRLDKQGCEEFVVKFSEAWNRRPPF